MAAAELAAAEEIARLGVWRWPRFGRTLELSAGLRRVLGLGSHAGTANARTLLRRLMPAHRQALFTALRTPDHPDLEITVADSRGISRSVLIVSVRRDETGYWGIGHDVTALRKVTAALDQSESRWDMALESAGQAAWDSNVVTGEVYHSRSWRAMRGMHPDGDVRDTHENWISRVHPDDIDRIQQLIVEQHAGRLGRVEFEYREKLPDGRYLWISSLGSPIEWDADGKPLRIVGTDTDITERKRAQAEMERLSRRLELALEVSGLGIFEANLETGEVFWDKAVRRIYGVSDDFVVRPDFWESTLHPGDYDAAVKRVADAVENKGTFVSDFRIIRPDGELRHVHTVGTWYLDAHGVPKVLGVNWDVTDDVVVKSDLERARELAEARSAELEAAKARIEYNALHDALTGLPNRRYLDQHLVELAREAALNGGAVSVLHIDLDLFKQINDTLGHAAGDAMLVHVADLLREATGKDDFVARVGGDEFCVVSPLRGSTAPLSILAHDIIGRIRRPVRFNGHDCRFGASIGIAVRSGGDVDPARLLIDADIALYRAKRRGKNRFEFFTAALEAEAVDTKRVADDIMRGIEQNEFFPHFQPLFDAQTMALVGVEALARWRHPSRGVLAPASFLKVAEDLSVVTAIDRMILEQAVASFTDWRAAGLDVPSVSVNVSFRRLHDQQLLASLRHLDIPPGTFAFELLESIFLDELDDIARWNLDQIRDMGIDINIDDFGTGHASIVSLLKLRPRRFKLDRQFLDGLTTVAAQRRLVRSIIDIGKSLGIKVVAEGVETTMQAEVLRELGCDILQGFAFGRPMSREDLEAFLGERNRRAS